MLKKIRKWLRGFLKNKKSNDLRYQKVFFLTDPVQELQQKIHVFTRFYSMNKELVEMARFSALTFLIHDRKENGLPVDSRIIEGMEDGINFWYKMLTNFEEEK